MAKTRPTRAGEENKLLGKNVLIFMNYGENASYESPVWSLIGGQRSADYSASSDEIDTTDKTSGGYGDSEPGLKTAELSVELIVKPNDETVKEMYTAYDADEPVDILRWAKDGRSIRNWYSITNLEESAAHDDACILSLTLKGKGAPTYIESMEDPQGTA